MQCFQGKSVYKGIAMGPIVVLKKNDYQVKRTRIEDTEAEVKRVDEALKASQEQLQKLYDKAVREVGEASAAIFEVHQMMLEDEDYLEAIQNMIRTEQVNAEYAVAVTGDNFAVSSSAVNCAHALPAVCRLRSSAKTPYKTPTSLPPSMVQWPSAAFKR